MEAMKKEREERPKISDQFADLKVQGNSTTRGKDADGAGLCGLVIFACSHSFEAPRSVCGLWIIVGEIAES